jgi:SET domain-containing protein
MTDVAIKGSAIHGKGVYATRAFRKGETVLLWSPTYLMADEIKDLPEEDKPYIDYVDGQPIVMGDPERFVNHSCAPNTMGGDLSDIAVRDIDEGEEITTNYAECHIPGGKMPCTCGTADCRGTIIGKNKMKKAS